MLDCPGNSRRGIFDIGWSTDVRMKAIAGSNDGDSTAFQFPWNRTLTTRQSTAVEPDNRCKLILASRATDIQPTLFLHDRRRSLYVCPIKDILNTHTGVIR